MCTLCLDNQFAAVQHFDIRFLVLECGCLARLAAAYADGSWCCSHWHVTYICLMHACSGAANACMRRPHSPVLGGRLFTGDVKAEVTDCCNHDTHGVPAGTLMVFAIVAVALIWKRVVKPNAPLKENAKPMALIFLLVGVCVGE